MVREKVKYVSLALVMTLLISIVAIAYLPLPVSAYSEDPYLMNAYYYIKNVRSGKYLDVRLAETADGTNIIQWNYTGAPNQKWLVSHIKAGFYKFVSALDSSKVITIEDASGKNGKNAMISTYVQNDVRQMFALVRNSDTTYRILSNASNYIGGLTVDGASCSNGANVFQYKYNATGNDEWIIEYASGYIGLYGAEYAKANYNNHLMTYPDLDIIGGNCANFVSQCMAVSGKHYVDEWYINKSNNTYLAPNSIDELNSTWQLADPSPWISASEFNEFWSKRVYTQTYSLDDIINNNSASSRNFMIGDVVQILKVEFIWEEAIHTMLITDLNSVGDKGSYKLTYQSVNRCNRSLKDICQQYKNLDGSYKIKFFQFI